MGDQRVIEKQHVEKRRAHAAAIIGTYRPFMRPVGGEQQSTVAPDSRFVGDGATIVGRSRQMIGGRIAVLWRHLVARMHDMLMTIGQRYRTADHAFLLAIVSAIFLLGAVVQPGGTIVTHTMQPAIFTLPEIDGDGLRLYISRPPIPAQQLESLDANNYTSLQVDEYVVQSGQTLSELAEIHNISMSTLASFNEVSNARALRAGSTYRVPDREGIVHVTKGDESVNRIAEQYGVGKNLILDANNLISNTLEAGLELFIPGAALSDFDLRLALGELFSFPVHGRLTSGYGYRNDPFTGLRRFHYGIDWATYNGAPIRAAMEGRISYVGTQSGGYGRYIIIKHPGGFQTLYGHLSGFNVRTGEYVNRGSVIGWLGNTGRSTGPHLHFSIIKNGRFVNPYQYLY